MSDDTKPITEHEGSKYLRTIYGPDGEGRPLRVDVYSVLVAFEVTCPARAHAVKKLLACGRRGKGTELDDLIGAAAALSRAIEIERRKQE
jgi:hypothetical protein